MFNDLEGCANVARILTILQIHRARSGHPGGSLSCIEILVALHSAQQVNQPNSPNKMILSKGHAAPALYAVAAIFGLIKPQDLYSFRKINGILQGHPSIEQTAWVNASTGSLGQGFSFAVGRAIASKSFLIDGRTFVILGDGELQEGQVWEAAMFSAHNGLDNLVAFIDYNKLQSDALNSEIVGLEPLAKKWAAFGWEVIEINGHSFDEIFDAIEAAQLKKDKPTVIIAHTIKGRGVDYMEGVPVWHGSATMSNEETFEALALLGVKKGAFKDVTEFKFEDFF